MFEIFAVNFEITEGENTTTQYVEAPQMMIETQFIQLMQQATRIATPIKIKLSRPEQIYDVFEQKMIERENSIVFKNNAYITKYGEDK